MQPQQSQKLNIDLSGIEGLAPRYFGDINKNISSPNARYLGNDSEMAEGIWNPFKRYGYISPANDSFDSVSFLPAISMSTTLGSSQTWQTGGVIINPYTGGTFPSVVGTPVSVTASGSVTSLSTSVTVSSGSNLILTVIAFGYLNPATSATFNGTAMTLVATQNVPYSYTIFQLVNPTVTTGTVVINYAVATSNAIAGCIVTKDSSQSVSTVYGTNNGSSSTASLSLTPTSNYSLMIEAAYSTAASHTTAAGQTEIFNLLTTATTFRFSESTKQANISTILSCTQYDDFNDDVYFAESGYRSNTYANIFQGDTLDDRSMVSVNSIQNANFTDLEIYQVNGVRKLFYVYTNASNNLDIGIATLPFSSQNNTWFTGTVKDSSTGTTTAVTNGTLTGGFMRKADNGFAYVFQDNVVHKIDGTTNGGSNGTVTYNVLAFPVFFSLTDAVDYKGKIFISVIQTNRLISSSTYNLTSDCGVYVWDRQSTTANMQDYIPVTGIKEIRKLYISPDGDLRMICVASDRTVQVRTFDGNQFTILKECGINSYPVYADSLVTANASTFWLGADGYIYAHGDINFQIEKHVYYTYQQKESLFMIGKLPSFSSSGIILYGGGNTYSTGIEGYRDDLEGLYLSCNDSSAITKLYKWSFNAVGTVNGLVQNANQGDIYSLVKRLPKLSTVNFIRIYGLPCQTSDSQTIATIKIYFNQSTTAWASKTIIRSDWARGYIDIPINKPYVNTIQFKIEFATNITLGIDDFAPSNAEIDYTPTETNK